MVNGLKSKAFRVMLVDIDYFDEVKQYLKSSKYYQFGAGIYYELESGLKVIYFYVEYSKPIELDISLMPYCRVQKAYKQTRKKFFELREISEEVWYEHAHEEPILPQKTLDDYYNPNIPNGAT